MWSYRATAAAVAPILCVWLNDLLAGHQTKLSQREHHLAAAAAGRRALLVKASTTLYSAVRAGAQHTDKKHVQNSLTNITTYKDFFRTCNVLPFSCIHLALWRPLQRQGKRPKVHAKQKGFKNFFNYIGVYFVHHRFLLTLLFLPFLSCFHRNKLWIKFGMNLG